MRYSTIAALLLMLICGVVSQAQNTPDDSWSLLLLDSRNQTLMRLSANADPQRYSVPLPAGYRIWRSSATNQDTAHFAYCLLNLDGINWSEGEQGRVQVGVYDLTTRRTVFLRDVGRGIHCDVAFHADGRLAVSYGAGRFQPAGANTWNVTVLDSVGDVLHTLQSGAIVNGDDVTLPAFRADGLDILIWERANHGRLVRWSPETNEFTTLARQIAAPYTAYLPQTGERVLPRRDTSYQAYTPANTGSGSGGGGSNMPNILALSGADEQERYIYHAPQSIIRNAVFIDGGQRLAVQLLTPQTGNNRPLDQYRVLTRDGHTLPLTSVAVVQSHELVGTPDGYIRIFHQQGRMTIYRSVDDQERVIYESAPGKQSGWMLVGYTPNLTTDSSADTDLSPFPPMDS